MCTNPILSLLIPVLNEEDSISAFLEQSRPAVERALSEFDDPQNFEWVFIDDGSTDATKAVILHWRTQDPRIKLISLSRNFGKEAALAAGIDHAQGDAVIPMDVDLQDPPEVIIDMVRAWQDGAQVVNAKRMDRSSDSWLKRELANNFYKLYNKMAEYPIPDNVGDFRLLSRPAVEVIKNLPERNRFNKGVFNWIGFKVDTVQYTRPVRAVGESKWKFWQLWNLAVDGIVSSTSTPLRVWSYIGALIALSSLATLYFCPSALWC